MTDLSQERSFVEDKEDDLAALKKENEMLNAQLCSTEAQLARTKQQLKEQHGTGSEGSQYPSNPNDVNIYRRASRLSSGSEKEKSSDHPGLRATYSSTRIFKIILIGDSGVGKTTFIQQLCLGEYSSNLNTTVGVDYYTKAVCIEGQSTSLKIWDTAGHERFRSISKSYMRDADGIILMYDVMDEASFSNVHNWMGDIRDRSRQNTVVMIVGNKIDLAGEHLRTSQLVAKSMGQNLVQAYRAHFAQVSAKTGEGVLDCCLAIVRALQEVEDDELEGMRKVAFGLSAQKDKVELTPRKDSTCC